MDFHRCKVKVVLYWGVLCWVLTVHAFDSVPFHVLVLVQGLNFFKHSTKIKNFVCECDWRGGRKYLAIMKCKMFEVLHS